MSDQKLKPGDPVEVYRVWASDGAGKPPLSAWHKGYTFVEYETDETRPPILRGTAATCIVTNTDGALAGAPIRYEISRVRPVQS